jgi:NADH-quinone oxidoreductase subunit H
MGFLTLILQILSYVFFYFLTLLVPVLLIVAFLTLVERKVIGSSQRRLGPNTIGFFGLTQPIADGLKLFCKETILPTNANIILFLATPVFVFFFSILNWLVIPFKYGLVFADIDLGVLYFFAISSLSVYGIVLAGWSSNSKYAFLGALRSAAQMIAYEVSIGLILISVLFCVSSLNFSEIVYFQETIWFIIPHFGAFILFFISALAETNRAPFDLPEAEAELVSGYNVEYSAMSFALFFLAEYANIILVSTLISLIFLGGWSGPIFTTFFFMLKILFNMILFIWVRTTLPRFRYDQLMRLGWKVFLPLSLGLIFINLLITIIFFI